MSGTGHTTTSVTSSGDSRIDGILHSTRWADATVTFSFPTSNTEYTGYGANEHLGHFVTTTAMQDVVRFAMDTSFGNSANDGFSIEGFTNLNIAYTTADDAHVRVSQTTLDPYNFNTAWAYYPSLGEVGGDVWLSDETYDYSAPETGDYASLTITHEVGHAMGLLHGHENAGFGALPSQYDAMEYTVMTYRSYVGGPLTGYTNETYGYAQTWMMQDIAALQYMYGADFSTNSGNTIYSWDPTSGDTLVNGAIGIDAVGNRIFATIWDGGGVDTYDLSAYTTALDIDLTPGGASLFSTTQQASLGGGNDASGNIYNALQYQGDVRSLIENATGGSGDDTIRGNQANNAVRGNDGDDRLIGLAGDDDLIGGIGRDVLMSGAGDDDLSGGADNDFLRGGGGADSISGGNGNDRLFGDAGGDDLFGLADDDTLYGGTGMDRLFGNAGNDELHGDDGRDFLNGGSGVDTMYGGNQRDVFVFTSVSDSPTGGLSDRIMDFAVGLDDIDLSAITATPFSIAIGGGFSGTGPSVITNEVGLNTLVFVDTDGDAITDMRIVVDGTLGLTSSDFIL